MAGSRWFRGRRRRTFRVRLAALLAILALAAAAGCGGDDEWVGASEGLGYLMLALNNQLATTERFAAALVLSLMGIALFFLVGLVERLVIPGTTRAAAP